MGTSRTRCSQQCACSSDDLPHLDPAVADVARTDFKRLRGHLYIQATYKVLAMLFERVTERVYGRTIALRGLARDPPSFTLAMASTRLAPRQSSAALSPAAQPSNYASTTLVSCTIPLLFLCHVRPRLATDTDLDIPLRPAWPSGSAGSRAHRSSG